MYTKRFDILPLPSKGLSYKNKCNRVKVYHMDGEDESLLTAPNLIASGDLIDELLQKKVKKVNDDEPFINPLDMLEGDRMSILIFLRSQMNPFFNMNAKNPNDGKIYKVIADLRTLKIKENIEEPDGNGLYEYKIKEGYWNEEEQKMMPITIKYRMMTGKDEKKIRVEQSLNKDKKKNKYSILKFQQLVVSLNGDTSEKNILTYSYCIPLMELRKFMKHIEDNKCGYDLYTDVKATDGGVAFKTFLNLSTTEFFYPSIG